MQLDELHQYDLGPRTPANLSAGARRTLLQQTAPPELSDLTPDRATDPDAIFEAPDAQQRQIDIQLAQSNANTARTRFLMIGAEANTIIEATSETRRLKERLFADLCTSFDATIAKYGTGPVYQSAAAFRKIFLQFWDNDLRGVARSNKQPGPDQRPANKTATNTYASVAKTARTPAPAPVKPARAPRPVPEKIAQGEDLRVFARVPEQAKSRNLQTYAVRSAVSRALNAVW